MSMLPLSEIKGAQVVGGQVVSRDYTGTNTLMGEINPNQPDVVILSPEGAALIAGKTQKDIFDMNIEDAEIVSPAPAPKRRKVTIEG